MDFRNFDPNSPIGKRPPVDRVEYVKAGGKTIIFRAVEIQGVTYEFEVDRRSIEVKLDRVNKQYCFVYQNDSPNEEDRKRNPTIRGEWTPLVPAYTPK